MPYSPTLQKEDVENSSPGKPHFHTDPWISFSRIPFFIPSRIQEERDSKNLVFRWGDKRGFPLLDRYSEFFFLFYFYLEGDCVLQKLEDECRMRWTLSGTRFCQEKVRLHPSCCCRGSKSWRDLEFCLKGCLFSVVSWPSVGNSLKFEFEIWDCMTGDARECCVFGSVVWLWWM